jgi:multiple sugar transport system ATP-binding protein
MLRLDELLDRRPAALSGGQRQRVAMGRAIVREPKAFLMDEPLSNLDAKLRVGMRAELANLHARLGATTVYVTHDQVEAMTLGQRVAVMREGRIQQVDTPKSLYTYPANVFVASFMGSPAMNLVEARLDGDTLEFGGHRIALAPEHVPATSSDQIVLGIRPESFEDASFADPSLPHLDVDVMVLEDLGSDALVVFQVDATPVQTEELRRDDEETLIARDGAKFTARVDHATAARAGAPLRLAVDPAGFHYFDRETGENCGRAEGSERAAPPAGSSTPAR